MLGLGNILTKGGALLGFPNKYSFNFDGSNDYLDAGSQESTWKNVSALSITAWIYIDAHKTHNGLIGKHQSDNESTGIMTTASSFKFYISSGGENRGSCTPPSAGAWHHIACVFNGGGTGNSGRMQIYFNGSLQSLSFTGTIPATTSNDSTYGTNSVTIGDYQGSNKFDGNIDEVAVWNTVLSASDVAKIASKPVDFSKASTYATDRTSNLKLWLRAGDKVLPEEDKSIARSDFYTDFDGTNDVVTTPSIDLGTTHSVSCWVKTSTGSKVVVGIDGTNYPIYLNSSLQINYDATGTAVSSADSIVSGAWNHVVVTRSGTTVNYYINGKVDSGGADTINANDALSGVFGLGGISSFYLLGQLSNVAFYKTQLDNMTISKMASNGRYTPMRDNRFSVVNFDGTLDYINVSTTLHQSNTGTISGWFNMHSTSGDQTFFSVGRDFEDTLSGNGVIRALFKDSSHNLKFIGYSADWDTGVDLVADTWYHLALTWSSNNIVVYVNGVAYSNSSLSLNTPTGTRLKIGTATWENNYYAHCLVSSVSQYSTAKSAEEIYAIYSKGITYNESSESGLVGLWRMGDDTSASYPTIADSSSNSNDGTLTNMASDDIVQQMVAGYDMGAFESTDLSDTYPAIIDVNEPVLGADIASSLTWVNSSSSPYETFVTSGNSITNAVNTSSFGIAYTSDFSLTSAKLYKISFDMDISSGSIDHVRIAIGTGMDTPTGLDEVPTNGTNTFYFIGNSTRSDFKFGFRGNDAVAFSLSNLSLKEIQGNVGTMTQMLSSNLVYSSVLPDQSFLTGVNSAYNFIDLDGSDQYLTFDASGLPNLTPYTITAWFKSTDIDQTQGIVLWGDQASYERRSMIIYNGGGGSDWTLVASINGENPQGSTTLVENQIYHGAVVVNPSTKAYKIYLDGDLDGSGTFSNSLVAWGDGNAGLIGKSNYGEHFEGSIYSASVWSKELSASEISAIHAQGRHYNLLDKYSDNLKGYWAMSALDASTGLSDSISTIYDRSGNSNHGTPTNADAGDLASSPNAEPNGYAKGDTNRSTTKP